MNFFKFLLIVAFITNCQCDAAVTKENKKYENIIWEGRFQPFHFGHLAYIKKIKNYAKNLWIIVLSNETSTEILGSPNKSPVPEFTKEVDPHHKEEKNPLPHWIRFLIVKKSIEEEFGADSNIHVTMGHRLDLDWEYYKKNLPPDRVFFTPLRDGYEDSKAKAWKKLGEKCVRIDVSDLPVISATMVREHVNQGIDASHLLPVTAINILENEKYL